MAPRFLMLLACVLSARPALAQQYQVTDLGSLSGGPTVLSAAINEAGQIVGSSTLPGFNEVHPFLWTDGTMQGPGYPIDLNDLIPQGTGWELATASGVNASGQIVGWGYVDHWTHAFLLTPVPPPGSGK